MFDLAIYYRMVGGFVGLPNTFLARLRWSIIMGCYMFLLSLVHHEGYAQGLIVLTGGALGTFLGRMIPHARFQATAGLKNSLGMAAVSVVRLSLILVPYIVELDGVHLWRCLLIGFGGFSGVAYYVGNKYLDGLDSGIYYRNEHTQYRISVTNPVFVAPPNSLPAPISNDSPKALNQAAVGGNEWGELLTGFLSYQLMFVFALVMS